GSYRRWPSCAWAHTDRTADEAGSTSQTTQVEMGTQQRTVVVLEELACALSLSLSLSIHQMCCCCIAPLKIAKSPPTGMGVRGTEGNVSRVCACRQALGVVYVPCTLRT
ncbi:unnamed protein product, partial [Ectocarpus sp. 12 AP-2014]